ncbi:hypothetical protein C0993_009662, partial [Termitomyces sp. T159_Od127]
VHLEEYICNGIVRGVAFEYNGKGSVKMVEDKGGHEGCFEEGEYALALAVPVLWGVLSCEPVKGFGDPGVIINEPVIEVGKTKKGLHLYNVPGWRPIEDDLHLSRVHANSIQSDNDAEVHNDKDVIHEGLEGGKGVGHIKRHYEVHKEAIASMEGGFSFMPQGYVYIVIAGVEVNLSIDFGTAEAVNKVTDEEEGIPVLFDDFVEAQIVNAKV